MSHNQYKSSYSNDYAFRQDFNRKLSDYNVNNTNQPWCAYIIHSHNNNRDKYLYDISDNSSPDFSKLCEDESDIFCDKPTNNKSKCFGCSKRCSKCDKCNNCGCKECNDKSSVLVSMKNNQTLPSKDYGQSHKKLYINTNHVNRKSKDSASRCKKFNVSFSSKEGHPWSEYNTNTNSIHINGKNGPVLHIYRGCSYVFCINQDNHDPKYSLVLTNSPLGGINSKIIPNGFAPVSKGCVCFKVDSLTPRYLYYQDSANEFMGGLIIVHDRK